MKCDAVGEVNEGRGEEGVMEGVGERKEGEKKGSVEKWRDEK